MARKKLDDGLPNETWGEWAKRVGVDLEELCKCGHRRIRHKGKKLLGGCYHEEQIYRGDPIHCPCGGFTKREASKK